MNLTLEELKEALCREHDVDTLLEMLGITPEELCDMFEERIASMYEELIEQVNIEQEPFSDEV
jgi:hypothetical protein